MDDNFTIADVERRAADREAVLQERIDQLGRDLEASHEREDRFYGQASERRFSISEAAFWPFWQRLRWAFTVSYFDRLKALNRDFKDGI